MRVKQIVRQQEKQKKKNQKKKPFKFPHWVLYPTWGLCLLTIFGSAGLITYYGFVFGNKKSINWLASVAVGIVSELFVCHVHRIPYLPPFTQALITPRPDLGLTSIRAVNNAKS